MATPETLTDGNRPNAKREGGGSDFPPPRLSPDSPSTVRAPETGTGLRGSQGFCGRRCQLRTPEHVSPSAQGVGAHAVQRAPNLHFISRFLRVWDV